MLGRFKRDARRAVQLRDDDALRAIDDKRALRRHQREFAHENFFFLRALAFVLQQERDIQRRAIGRAFAQAFEPVHFRLADFVGLVIEHDLAIVALDGKHFAENRFEADVLLALGRGQVRLQKFRVGIRLQLDHVRRGDDFLDFAEIDTFCGSRWHFITFLLGTATRRTNFHLTTQGKPAAFNGQLATTATECPTS